MCVGKSPDVLLHFISQKCWNWPRYKVWYICLHARKPGKCADVYCYLMIFDDFWIISDIFEYIIKYHQMGYHQYSQQAILDDIFEYQNGRFIIHDGLLAGLNTTMKSSRWSRPILGEVPIARVISKRSSCMVCLGLEKWGSLKIRNRILDIESSWTQLVWIATFSVNLSNFGVSIHRFETKP